MNIELTKHELRVLVADACERAEQLTRWSGEANDKEEAAKWLDKAQAAVDRAAVFIKASSAAE